MKKLMLLAACVAVAGTATAQPHFYLGPDWTVGIGTYAVVPDGDGNNILVAAAINGADPKHAWVDVGASDYTVTCDVRMDTWFPHDHSRAGIAGRIMPDGTAPGGSGDRGINLLFHYNNVDQVQFLNDNVAWGPDEAFTWSTGTWYTFEMTIAGDTMSGSITNKSDATDTVVLAPWSFNNPQDRTGTLAGITPSTREGLVASYDNFVVTDAGGAVLFADDFETPGPPMPRAIGLNTAWTAGEAGLYISENGVLHAISSSGVDPKHLWVGPFSGSSDYTIRAKVRMDSWIEDHDHSRSGIAGRIMPDPAPDGDHDRAVNLLFHEDDDRVQFLNDLRAWGPEESAAWALGEWTDFELTFSGGVVSGSIGGTALADWSGYSGAADRTSGLVGVTASTNIGLVASFDDFEVIVGDGVVFSDDFESSSTADNWSLYE